MAEGKRKKGLGRGLSALLDDVAEAAPIPSPPSGQGGVRMVGVHLVRPNPNQPRRSFPQAEMEDLTNSVREKGVLQPLLVRPDPDDEGRWQIVAGERRWRAAQAAQLHEVPIVVREFTDEETLEVGIIENVQRDDLNPIDEAMGYQQLIERFGHTQAALAKIIGKSRPYIANALRLLALPDDVREFLSAGKLTAGHARALVTAEAPSVLARKVVAEGLSVRRTEELARQVDTGPAGKRRAPAKDADTKVLEDDLSATVGMRVEIGHKSNGEGTITIKYKSLEDLDSICRLLSA